MTIFDEFDVQNQRSRSPIDNDVKSLLAILLSKVNAEETQTQFVCVHVRACVCVLCMWRRLSAYVYLICFVIAILP